MGEYRLSNRAHDDLIAIAQYGDEHFGVAQSGLLIGYSTAIDSLIGYGKMPYHERQEARESRPRPGGQ
jgi:plasmid stabilization system protein ParE